MSAEMRAARALADLAARSVDAVALARYASLAVRIDAPLLRRLRLAMLRGSDAGAEADLWFSDLSESRGDDGFVLDDAVAAILRRELAAEHRPDGSRAIDGAWQHLALLHAGWPASLQLEERLTYLALARGAAAGAAIDEALQPALIAMASQPERAVEVARWAVRALPRLPAAARDSDAAVALLLAATAVVGSAARPLAAAAGRALPVTVGWLIPAGVRESTSNWTCELEPRALRLRPAREADPAQATVALPRTRPPMVQLEWLVEGSRHERLEIVRPDAPIALPEGWRALRLRTLGGAVYAIEAPAAAQAPPEAENEQPQRGCVQVRCGDLQVLGVQVAPGTVLAPLSGAVAAREGPAGTVPIVVEQFAYRVGAAVVATDSRVDLALLALDGELPHADVMSRADAGPQAGTEVRIAAATERWVKDVRGQVLATGVATTAGGRRFEGLTEIGVDLAGWTGPPDLAGAAVLVDGALAGLVLQHGHREVFASPPPVLARFLSWAMRPAEHEPDVFVSYAPTDEYGKGVELDERAIDRVHAALRAARLRPWDTEDTPQATKAGGLQPIDIAAGAVAVFTPVARGTGPVAERELAAIVFRCWADPAFPVALAAYRVERPPLPRALAQRPVLDLDALDDEALWQALHETLDGEPAPWQPPSEDAFEAAARQLLGLTAEQGAARSGAGPGSMLAAFEPAVRSALARLGPEGPGPREVVEFAAMLALPGGETLAALRRAAEAAPGHRAVHLNAMPVQFARLLLRKAWYPRRPPSHVVIRDPSWPSDGTVQSIVDQVAERIRDATDAPRDGLQWFLARATGLYAVIFATRPLPAPSVVAALQAALPGALLFFLGQGTVDTPAAEAAGVMVLPPLRDTGESLEWIQAYKRLMNSVAPRPGAQASA